MNFFLEDLVPKMLHPRSWEAWIPEEIWNLVPFDMPIGIAHDQDCGWIIWSRDLTFVYPENISITREDPNYKEPSKCGYTVKTDDTSDTPPPRVA